MIIKVTPDKEKVKSILNLIEGREKFVSTIQTSEFSTIVAENYYEIIKELIISLLLLDGLKTTGDGAHKEMIEQLSKHNIFSDNEIALLDDLRVKRNKSSYEGKPIDKIYLENKKADLNIVIDKLKNLIDKKL